MAGNVYHLVYVFVRQVTMVTIVKMVSSTSKMWFYMQFTCSTQKHIKRLPFIISKGICSLSAFLKLGCSLKYEDTKGIIRSRKTKKDTQYIGRKEPKDWGTQTPTQVLRKGKQFLLHYWINTDNINKYEPPTKQMRAKMHQSSYRRGNYSGHRTKNVKTCNSKTRTTRNPIKTRTDEFVLLLSAFMCYSKRRASLSKRISTVFPYLPRIFFVIVYFFSYILMVVSWYTHCSLTLVNKGYRFFYRLYLHFFFNWSD
jgi:hypothetical protein